MTIKGAWGCFGQKFGWERANWFAPEGVPQEDHWSFRRSNYFEHIGNEVRNVAKNAGLLDMSAFAKARFLARVPRHFWIIWSRISCQKSGEWRYAMP